MCPSNLQLVTDSPVSTSEIQDVSVCPTCMITLLCLVVRFRMCPSVQLAENSSCVSLVRFRMCSLSKLDMRTLLCLTSEIQDVSVCPTCMRTLLCLVVRFRMCPSVQLA